MRQEEGADASFQGVRCAKGTACRAARWMPRSESALTVEPRGGAKGKGADKYGKTKAWGGVE